jgi:hypothetical protein
VDEPLRVRRVDRVYVLTVDVAGLPLSGGPILALARREQSNWLLEAALHTQSAVVLVTDDSVEFYTSEQDYLRAMRQPLRLVTHQARELPGFRAARVTEHTGPRALRRLMNYAAGLWSDASGAHRAAGALQRAGAIADACHTLCPSLCALFQAAANVGSRVAHESSLHDPRLRAASRELEIPSVERIIEEELANLRSYAVVAATHRQTRLQKALTSLGTFEKAEPSSEVRLRIAIPVDPQIHYFKSQGRSSQRS